MSALVTAGIGEGKKSKQKERVRIVRRPLHGVLLLDKPKGISSNDALQKVKWLLRAEKAGHTGTLDPLATGLLPICLGATTKFSQMHLDADKQYEAIAQLGIKTTTGDAEGEVIAKREVNVSEDMLQSVLKRFLGCLEQVPPMHSALKKNGKALYEYARAGLEVERLARSVTIHALSGVFVDKSAIKLIVNCSKGTYIRTLAEDIGEALGCGAHLSSLRRTATGDFSVAQCITIEALEGMNEDQRLAHLLPVDVMLDGHVKIELDTDDSQRFTNGLPRKGAWPDAKQVAVYEKDSLTFLGLGQVRKGELHPERLLSKLEIAQMNTAKAH